MEPTTSKPWYAKPENRTGVVLGLLLIAGAVWSGNYILPFVISAATNMIHMAILLAVLGGIIVAVLDKDIHNLVYYGWKALTRGLTGMLIDLDPISIVETSLKVMQSRLDEMMQNKNEVGGQLKSLDAKIKSNSTRIEMDMKKAQQADKQGDSQGKQLMALEAQGLVNSNKNLIETRNKIELMFRVLDKMTSTVDFNIKKTRSELDIKKEERKVIMSAHSAMTKGWKIIGGTSAEKEMFDRAMESIADTANRQLAEIDNIMDLSKGVIKGVDLEKGVMQDDAMKMLEQWEKGGESALLGTSKAVLISQAYDPSQSAMDVTPKPIELTGKVKDRFSDLLQ